MAGEGLLDQLGANWGWIALRGAAAVVFGALAFAWPGVTLVVLTLWWGAYALAEGVLALIAAFRVRDGARPMWALVVVGILGIAAGILTFLWPSMTALLLLTLIAVWAFFMGIFQIAAALRLRKEIKNEWLLGLSGVLSVAFGAMMLASPGDGALAVVWVIASFAVLFGVLMIMLALQLKQRAADQVLAKRISPPTRP